jgi:hypothetical protein
MEADVWAPGITFPTPREPGPRGLLDRRGLIHAHSVYSHDACDGAPVDDDGVRDEQCFQDFHRGLCRTQHDFVMLTDHRESFADIEYPETVLYRADRGDETVSRGGVAVANWAACADVDGGAATDITPLIMAGCEGATMPVGLAGHVSADKGERATIYGEVTPASIEALRAGGAVTLVSHTEDWTVEQLTELPLDGFEMYNLHANLFLNLGEAAVLIATAEQGGEGLPHPSLLLLPIMSEDPIYLDTWSAVLATGAHRVTTMGTDCHRNTFTQELADGQRVDSYERMMKWFSNHLLVRPGNDGRWDDQDLKDALASGRLYGVFEVLGYPRGFDFHALEGESAREMGDTLSLAAGATFKVVAPDLYKLDPAVPRPDLVIRLLRASAEGWQEVATEQGAEGAGLTLTHTPTEPGAYRAEVRIIPRHLAPYVGEFSELLEEDFVWIYSNPIYVEA